MIRRASKDGIAHVTPFAIWGLGLRETVHFSLNTGLAAATAVSSKVLLEAMKGETDVELRGGGPEGIEVCGAYGNCRVPSEGHEGEACPGTDPISKPDATASIDGRELANAVAGVLPAVSEDARRYHLDGISVEVDDARIRLTATDGHRLHHRLVSCSTSGAKYIAGCLPATALTVLAAKGGDVQIDVGGTLWHICQGPLTVVARAEDDFPPYEQVIPKTVQLICTVDRRVFVEAVKRLVGAVKGLKKKGEKVPRGAVFLTDFSGKAIVGQVTDCDTGDVVVAEVKIPVRFESCAHRQKKIAINPSYMLEAIESMDGDEITVGFNGPRDPVKFSSRASLAIVMPMI